MKLVRRLADHVLEAHPERAAILLERFGEEEAVRRLRRGSVSSLVKVLGRLSPATAAAVLQGIETGRAARALDALEVEATARLLRRIDAARREELLGLLGERRGRGVRSLLGFPENSVGALMDPDVMALPQELTAREALQRVRKSPELARYNLYVVEEQHRLVGALNLRELLLARGRAPLSDIMVRNPHRLPATADRTTVLAHPGWREVHALPVVDASDAYLGAVRYRTLRELEQEMLAPRSADADAAASFGELIAAAARGVLDSFAGAPPPGAGRKGE